MNQIYSQTQQLELKFLLDIVDKIKSIKQNFARQLFNE